MDNTQSIAATEKTVQIRGGKESVTVTEPSWKALRAFLGKITEQASRLVSFDATGAPLIDKSKIVGVITSSLADDMLMAVTGKDADWVGDLPFSDAVALLVAAVEVTFHPNMIDTVKNALGRLQVIGTQTGTSDTPA